MSTQVKKSAAAQHSEEPVSSATGSNDDARAGQAREVVRRNVYWALGVGLIPFPAIDFLAVTGVQVKMLKELSAVYEVKFFEDKAKTIVGSLITGLGSLSIGGMVARSLLKVVPVVGQIAGVVGGSLIGGALTLAIGNLFAMHYESGGTLLDFDIVKMRDHFRKEFETAKGSVKNMQAAAK